MTIVISLIMLFTFNAFDDIKCQFDATDRNQLRLQHLYASYDPLQVNSETIFEDKS